MMTQYAIVWCVRWCDAVWRTTNCRSKAEAERLAEEMRRQRPESKAVADWHCPTVNGD